MSHIRERSRFGMLWASQASSNLGDGILQVAAPLLVASLTRDPLLVAGMTAAQYLPWLLAALPSGALTDRLDRRRVLVLGNGLRGVGFAALAVPLALGWEHVALLYAAVFLAGCAETLVDNAALTIPPRLVPRERLERANGRLFATQSVVNTFIGPPAGAALFGASAAAAFFTGSALFALAGIVALALPALRPNTPPSPTTTTIARDMREGWIHFWSHRLLRRVAFISGAINLFSTATTSVLVLLVTGPLSLPDAAYGLFVAIPAVGAIVGSLLAEYIVPRIGGGPITWAAALAPAASWLILGLSPSVPLGLAGMFVAAVATALNQIVVSTLRQAAVPDALMGRVTAAYRLIVLGAVPVGALLGGGLGRLIGIQPTFVACAAGLAVAAALLAPRVRTGALREAEISAF